MLKSHSMNSLQYIR